MTHAELAEVLKRLGCPPGKAQAMAKQLDRKARMDADRKREPYEETLRHLVGLMAQGWAAQNRETGRPNVTES
jgi:hypothetical protein